MLKKCCHLELDFETATLRVTHHVIATPPRGKGLVLTIDPGCRNLLWQLRSGGCSYKGMRPCDHVLLTRTAWPTLGRSCHPPLEADRYCLRSRLNFDLHVFRNAKSGTIPCRAPQFCLPNHRYKQLSFAVQVIEILLCDSWIHIITRQLLVYRKTLLNKLISNFFVKKLNHNPIPNIDLTIFRVLSTFLRHLMSSFGWDSVWRKFDSGPKNGIHLIQDPTTFDQSELLIIIINNLCPLCYQDKIK